MSDGPTLSFQQRIWELRMNTSMLANETLTKFVAIWDQHFASVGPIGGLGRPYIYLLDEESVSVEWPLDGGGELSMLFLAGPKRE